MRQKRITGDKQMQRTPRKEPMTEMIQKKRREQRNWKSMSDGELITYAKKIIKENGIRNRNNLQKVDQGMYYVLRRRNLLGKIIPEKQKRRNWSSMTDEKIISYAKKIIEENKIKNRSNLRKADSGLGYVLKKRKLMVIVIPEKQQKRNWSSISEEELIQFSKNFIEEKGIKNRKGLQKADYSLYEVLKERDCLNTLIPEKRRQRDWSSMTDKEIIKYAKTYVEKNAIKNRRGLAKADMGLYTILWRRNLLSAVFSDIEKSRKIEGIKQVVDAMKEFGEKK